MNYYYYYRIIEY